jgi:hypothetical protein
MTRPVSRYGGVGAALALFGAAFALGAGCGSNGSASSLNGFVSQYCDIFRPCCMAAGLRSDGAQCRSLLGGLAPASSYDAAAGEACLAAMRAAAMAGPALCETGETPPECENVFGATGTAAPGATCAEDEDCAPSAQGKVKCEGAFQSGGGEIRKCQVQVVGTAGSSPCVATIDGSFTYYFGTDDDVVSLGYTCNVADGVRCDGTTNVCVALKAVGAACASSTDCVRNAYCDGVQDTCAALKALGADCSLDAECMANAFCSSTTNTCSARKAAGATCGKSAECVSKDCVNSKCGAGSDNFALTFICGTP